MKLPPFANKAIESRLASGRYASRDEVLQRAFDALAETEIYEDDARAGILEGLEELDSGEGVEAADVFAMLRERHKDSAKQGTA